MTTKKKPAKTVDSNSDVLAPELRADLAVRPTINAAAVIQEYGRAAFGELDVSALAIELRASLKTVENNDMSRCEAMLYLQANALQSIFTNLARRANKQEYLKQLQSYMTLAFKAQNQCRMTLETLALIKNPPVFARQANIAHGPQQANNGTLPPAASPTRAENSQPAQNELLEVTHGERLDTTTAGTTGGADPAVATLEPLDRAANGKR